MIEKLCRQLQEGDEGVETWQADAADGGITLSVVVEGQPLLIHVAPRGAGAAYAKTRSLSLSIRKDSELLDARVERFMDMFVGLVDRIDRGDLHVPTTEPTGKPVDKLYVASPEDEAKIQETPEELADKVHWASFVAYKALTTGDLYPHCTTLGTPIADEDIAAGWRRTVRRIKEGSAPQQLAIYAHIVGDIEQIVADAERCAAWVASCSVTSVIFGGKPSSLSSVTLRELFVALHASFDIADGASIMFEDDDPALAADQLEVLAEHNHPAPTRVSDALRRQPASILGLGVPAWSHAFGSYFYQPDVRDGQRVWLGFKAEGREEQHQYIVSSFRHGFSRAAFAELFQCDPVEAFPESFSDLGALGVAFVDDDNVQMRGASRADHLTYRVFFYSDAVHARINERWAEQYDRSESYTERIADSGH